MSYYTIYDPATGDILRSGQCPQKQLAIQAHAGEALLAGVAGDDISQRIVDDGKGAKTVAMRAAADIAARTPAPANVQALTISDVISALGRKGIALLPTDFSPPAAPKSS